MEVIPNAKPKLILHAGTTKTGTSSLQAFMHRFRRELIDNGILYSGVGIEPDSLQPKHQWIVSNLLMGDESLFLTHRDLVLEELSNYSNVRTVVLSTEGVYNHWWTFSDAARMLLKSLQQSFEVVVWVVFREPLSYVQSLYGQIVQNPKSPLISCYATSEPLETVINDPWFSSQLQYADFIRSIESLFDIPLVVATRYEDSGIINQAMKILKIDRQITGLEGQVNLSLGEISLELIRRLNLVTVDPLERERFVGMIRILDPVIRREEDKPVISDFVKSKVEEISRASKDYLRARYRIDWE